MHKEAKPVLNWITAEEIFFAAASALLFATLCFLAYKNAQKNDEQQKCAYFGGNWDSGKVRCVYGNEQEKVYE